jgi:hypothetical protein
VKPKTYLAMKQILLLIAILFASLSYAQTKIESSIEQSYSNGSYTNSGGSNYAYDSNGNLLSESSLSWDNSSSTWTQGARTTYTYNANNKATKELYQNWDGSQFVNSYVAHYTYDSNGLLTGVLYQDWSNSQWVNTNRSTISYNSNQTTGILNQNWNNGSWVNENRGTVSYTGNNLTQILNEDWDGTQWTTSDRDRFTYNANSKKTTVILETWNGSAWVEEERTEYILDASENRTSETAHYIGVPQSKYEYTYDTSTLMSAFHHPFKDKTGADYITEDFPYIHKILSQTNYAYNTSTSSFEILGRIVYDYANPITLSTKKIENINRISVYPNPSNDFIKIYGLQKNKHIKIYNVLGNIVKEQNILPNQEIDIKGLNNGIYFLELEKGDTKKIIKQ